MTRYVGVDLHRRRSVIVVLEADGTELWTHRIDNSPVTLDLEIETGRAGTGGGLGERPGGGTGRRMWSPRRAGGRVHLTHPLGIAG